MGREPEDAQAVAVCEVSKSFGNGLAVDRVSFVVKRGACFGLLGQNGAGKSTTLKMIYGSLRPTSGVIRVEGIDVARHPSQARRRVGIAPQDDTLDSELSVGDNLLFHARYSGVPGAEARSRVDRLLGMMELDGRHSDAVSLLSAGLRRRLVLARALLCDPRVVVLDEPTRGLDAASRSLFLDHMRELKRQGVAVVLATHDQEEASLLCDEAAVMERGRIAEVGDASLVLASAGSGRLTPPGPGEGFG